MEIQINHNKSQAIFVSRSRAARYLPDRSITSQNSFIVWSNELKYLGLIIDKHLSFKNHTEQANIKAQTYIQILYLVLNRNSLRIKNQTNKFSSR